MALWPNFQDGLGCVVQGEGGGGCRVWVALLCVGHQVLFAFCHLVFTFVHPVTGRHTVVMADTEHLLEDGSWVKVPQYVYTGI